MNYQWIWHWPVVEINDYENTIQIETFREQNSSSTSRVDGHDAVSGEMNIHSCPRPCAAMLAKYVTHSAPELVDENVFQHLVSRRLTKNRRRFAQKLVLPLRQLVKMHFISLRFG
jgi:hypothetical protein